MHAAARIPPFLLLPLLGVTAVGCEEIDPYLPTVSFNRLDVQDVDWSAVDSEFVFDVSNPNPLDIELATFEYGLDFEGVQWLSGESEDGLVLEASADNELALPVALEFENLYDMVQAVRGQDDIAFTLDGKFGFDTPIGLVELPYDAGGDFPAVRTPEVELGKLDAAIDWTALAANLDLKLHIDNDHGSNLWFQDFDYAVDLVGEQVASGVIDDFAEIEGATTATVSIPMELDLVSVGSAVYSALTGEQIEVGLQATTDVDTPFGVIPLSIDESGAVTID